MALRYSIARHAGVLAAAWLALCPAAAPAYDNGSTDPAGHARTLWKQGAELHLEGDYPGAIEHFRSALKFSDTALIHTYLGWSLSKLGRFDEAVEECRRAIALDPDYPNAYNDLGAYLIGLNRPREAVPWLRKATELPGYCCPHYAYYQLGRAMLMQARVEEAIHYLEAALALRPRYQPARALLYRIQSRGLKGL